jgi:hypothetical protein
LAEDLAFNQTLGIVYDPILDKTKDYIDFYRKYRQYYVNSADCSGVGIFRSWASLTYNNSETQLCTILTEQALIQAGIPFSYVFDDGFQDLAKYAVVILPDSECLSDQQGEILRQYVEAGGGVIAIGQAGLYDQWRRVRVIPGLRGLVDHQPQAHDYQERVHPSVAIAGPASKKEVGRGRVAYLGALEFDGEMPPHNPDFAISNEFWKRPRNWRQLIELIHWAANEKLQLAVDGPEYLVVNCTRQMQACRMMIHLVNYNAAQSPVLTSIGVRFALTDQQGAKKVTAYSPSTKVESDLEFKTNGSNTELVIAEMQTYTLVVVEW